MGRIVAIGGGEIGRPGRPIETDSIDREIIRLSGKSNPKVLFVPTASGDSDGYADQFNKYYSSLGCVVDTLRLYDRPSFHEVKQSIDAADIIYVGGGNTLKMITLWRKFGVDKLLRAAHKNDKVLAGLSAGAICWFDMGLSDSRSFAAGSKSWSYIFVHGLGLENIVLCPHFDAESNRQPALRDKLKHVKKPALALDNCAALEIVGDTFRIITSKPNARVHKVFWDGDDYRVIAIPEEEHFRNLVELE